MTRSLTGQNEAQSWVSTEQTQYLYQQLPTALYATLAVGAVLVIALWQHTSSLMLISWAGLLAAITLCRFTMLSSYKRASPSPADNLRWRYRFIVGAASAGIVWGLAGFMLMPSESLGHQLLVIFIVGGMMAGASQSLAAVMTAFTAYSLPALLLTAAWLFLQNDPVHLAMAFLLLSYMGGLTFLAHNFNTSLITWLQTRFENVNLIQGLNEEINERKQAEVELKYRAHLEMLIAKLSNHFINLNSENVDKGINHALQTIGEFTSADRSYVFLLSSDRIKMDNTHEWCAEGAKPQIDNLKNLPVETFPWWMTKIGRLESIHIPRVADLPSEAKAEREILQAQDIRSVIVVPMASGNMVTGFLGFDSVKTEKVWTEEIIALLKIVGEMFVNALERKKTETALAEKTMYLDNILRSSTEYAIATTDLDFRITYYNPMAEKLFGHGAAEVIGKTVPEIHIMKKVAAERFDQGIENVRRHGMHRYLIERETENDTCFISAQITAIRDAAGELVGYAHFSRDITETRERENAIARLSDENTRLARQMIMAQEAERHHIARELHDELGQSLALIRTELSRAINRSKELPEISACLRTIDVATNHVLDVTRGMLHWLRPTTLDRIGLKGALVELTSSWKRQHHTDYTLSLPARLPRLSEDSELLIYRIMQECLTNIARHAEASHVHIRLGNKSARDVNGSNIRRLQLTVEDNGCGMDVDNDTTKGLGLIGMRERAHAVGGELFVHSKPGKGTKITVTLPPQGKQAHG